MTTTPELSREQRDAVMVERYSDGETLDAIPRGHGSWMNTFLAMQD